ncbi:MAG: hypothetical protein NDI60_05925 [Elusimicrobiales bacterium]|nr:hypothetical protein [Elusimicrobiales bacterium]
MYLLIEQGRLLPPFRNLGIYIHALRLVVKSSSAMQLVSAWLRATLGDEPFRDMLEPFLNVPPVHAVASPLNKTVKKLLSKKKFFISPEQMAVIVSNRATWLCWNALLNDTAAWSSAALARKMGVSCALARLAFRKLAEAKLIKRQKDGTYKCLMAGAMLEYPQGNLIPDAILRKFQEFGESASAAGEKIFMRRGLLRASALEFHNCFPLLELNLETAAAYGITQKQRDSALFSVSCDVVKIRDF